MRNLQEQVKKAFCYQKLFWPFTVRINCSSDLKKFSSSQPSASNFKRFSLEHFFLTVVQNNFGNKLPLLQYSMDFALASLGKCFSGNMKWAPENKKWLFSSMETNTLSFLRSMFKIIGPAQLILKRRKKRMMIFSTDVGVKK